MNLSPLVAIVLAVTLATNGLAQVPASPAKVPATLELFGTKLQGASRTQLRDVFKKAGLQSVREDDRYWVDIYRPDGVLEGASKFSVGYVEKTEQFAIAEYKFKGFMDVGLVAKVARMVTAKYGRPNSQSGDPTLGEVHYRWIFPKGMSIKVSRGWPDTTTFLTYVDQTAYAQLQAEEAADKQAQEKAKAKTQSSAF